jgi:hypothetical protein
MNLKNKLVSSVGILALSLSMTAGVAMAAQTHSDKEITELNVICIPAATVDVEASGAFSIDRTTNPRVYDATGVKFDVEMDLTCNWSDKFQVDAKIGEFKFDGTLPSGEYAPGFSGAHLRWSGGHVSNYDGITYGSPVEEFLFDVPWAGKPEVSPNAFHGRGTTERGIIENESVLFVKQSSPGVTTATWNGELKQLPPNLANGTYKADLVVTLTVN